MAIPAFTATNNLYLVSSYGTASLGGAIFSGKPDPDLPAPQLYREYRSSDVNEVMYQFASDSQSYNPAFTVLAVTSSSTTDKGRILLSSRYGNEVSTWAEAYVASQRLQGCAFGNNTWIAVGRNNLVVRTTDGVNWTELSGAVPGARWKWLTFGGGRFVAVGFNTVPDPENPAVDIQVGAVMYSDDDGLTWTSVNSGTKNQLSSVAYSPELNVFVAVGDNGTVVSVKGS